MPEQHPNPRREPRLRIPTPPWIEAWPRGLRPTTSFANHRGVEFTYRAPDDRWFRVVALLAPGHRSGLEVRPLPSADPATTARLAKAVELRLRRCPEAPGWLAQALLQVEALARLRSFGGAGGLDRREQAIDELLATIDAVREREHELGPGELDDLEQTLADAGVELDAVTLAKLGVALWLAAGAVERALELWQRHGAAIEAREDHSALACSAIMRSFLGRVTDAQAQAIRLAARSRDAIDARHAAELFEQLRRPDLAAEQLRVAACDAGRASFDVYRRLGRVAAEARDRALVQTAATVMREHAKTDEQRLLAALMHEEAGDFAMAELILEQLTRDGEHSEAARQLARIRVWRLDHRSAASLARAVLERCGPDPLTLRTLAVAELLEGRGEAALELIDRALEFDDDDHESLLWRAEILYALDRVNEARVEVARVKLGDHPPWQLLHALIRERIEPGDRRRPVWFIIDHNIRGLLGDEAPEDSRASHEIAIETITCALARLGGNRSTRLTTPTPDGSLRWLDELASPRFAAERLQLQATASDVDEVIAKFAALAETHPHIPFYVTYAAELLLWRGHYEQAFAEFERVWLATRTRWGYVGAGAAAMLLGRDEQALALWEAGEAYYAYLDAEATYCYRGELYRRRGELELARLDLELAVATRPARLGAWINLALLEHAAGREQPLREAVARVEALCPPHAWEARRELGLREPATLEPDALAAWMTTLLERMRGNRSSVMYTLVDGDGTLRVFPVAPAQTWRSYGRRCLPLLTDELLGALAQRV
jgi:tetratricopeptide (TPR) repeat protein